MTASTLQLSDGSVVRVPRGARWAASAFTAAWSFLEKVGEARARRALHEAAASVQHSNPSLAAELRGAARRDA
jgi:hypothetical protein